MDGMLSHFEELLEAENVFVRNKKQRKNLYIRNSNVSLWTYLEEM